ncbi:MAG: glycosyltransferase family 39 protein [Microgenomates group bacterium]|nr:glycosyltransferase family 39 protein [Microgenomates group bacterium]
MLGRFVKTRYWLIIFLIIYLIFSLLTYKDYGISIDERPTYYRGKLLYIKIRGNDQILQKDFVVKGPDSGDLLDHNHLHHAILYIFNGQESMEKYHLLNLIFAVLIFIAIYEVLFEEFKNGFFALLGPIFLVFTPRFFGDLPVNPTDIPFAIYYFLSLSLIYLSRKWEQKLRILLLGLSFGATQSMRMAGYLIYPIYFFYYLLCHQKKEKKIKDFLLELILIFLIGYLIHIISLPYLGADPFNHFFHLANIALKYPWPGEVLFLGKFISSTSLPWTYLPVWFLITTPVFILFLFCLSFFYLTKKNQLLCLFLISLAINLTVFFICRPVVYDGLRHMDYLLPQIIVLSIAGLYELVKNPFFKKIALVLITLNMILIVKDYFSLYPYPYLYFNELIGGLKGAYGQFETDYWGEANKEAANWLRKELPAGDNKPKPFFACGNAFAIGYYLRDLGFEEIRDADKASYIVCWTRNNDHKKFKGKILKIIKKDGVPLVYIFSQKQ